jgi:uncharacterized protein (DUF1330 family)
MAAYVIFGFGETPPDADLSLYRKVAQESLALYGGRFLAGGRPPRAMEGMKVETGAIFEFDTVAAAEAWYDSPEFRPGLESRLGVRECVAWILESWTGAKR